MKNRILILSVVFLTIIPFVWLKPGEMDLGGDSSRLYFYDPLNYLQNFPLYGFMPDILSANNSGYYLIPFVSVLAILKYILGSSYLLITLFNSFQLVVAFLSTYYISQKLLKNSIDLDNNAYLASIIAGLLYTLSPILIPNGWDRAMFIHNQFFLNPLIFYLLLQLFLTRKILYGLLAVVTTFIFAPSFSPSPSLFGFYPLAFMYLLAYITFVKKQFLPIKQLIITSILFVLINSFHLMPTMVSFVTDENNTLHQGAFSEEGKYIRGLGYFESAAMQIKIVKNILGLPQTGNIAVSHVGFFEPLWIVLPILLLFGLIINKKINKHHKDIQLNFIIVSFFFLITVFLMSAKLTNIGFELYKSFFNIPGFSMFRNFVGQFGYIFAFFYVLVISHSLFAVFTITKGKMKSIIFLVMTGIIVLSAGKFIRGDITNLVLNIGQSKEFKIPIVFDSSYEEFIDYTRNNTFEGRILSLPFNESYTPMVAGSQGGMYQGQSIVTYLAGKSDVNGYQTMFPFSETFLQLAKAKDYKAIDNLMRLLNIRYIFYNRDENIYKYFPDFPYSHVRDYMPPDRQFYSEFLSNLPITEKKRFGENYILYEVNKEHFLPKIYIPNYIEYYDAKSFKNVNGMIYTTEAFFDHVLHDKPRTVFTENKEVSSYINGNIPQISVKKINPTYYVVSIQGAKDPFILVFSQPYNSYWKAFILNKKIDIKYNEIFFNGDIKESSYTNSFFHENLFRTWSSKEVPSDKHIKVNGYANAWMIEPKKETEQNYTIILELASQRIFYVSLCISILTLLGSTTWIGLIGIKSKLKFS